MTHNVQDPKKVTPEQIAELRAAVDAHFRVRSPAARERAIDLFFQNHIALLDAAERCALADEHGALALGLAFAQARQDLTAAIARAEAAEKERDDIARRLGEAEHNAANFARWFTQAAQHLHIVQPIYLGRAQCDGAVRDAKAYLATLTTPPADGSGEGA